jgi:hypothetical protein
MRSIDEIVAKIKERQGEGFDFWVEVLIVYLPFKNAKRFLKEGVGEKEWAAPRELTQVNVIDEMRKYMEFAWEKVDSHRGLSTSRSVNKMEAWLWLLESDLNLEDVPYENYGAPKLAAVCKKFDFLIPDDDAIKRMIEGESCIDNCMSGCGS